MMIERTKRESRTFNLDDATELAAWNALLDDPSVRIVQQKIFNHSETEQEGRDRFETKDQRIYAEWEVCSL